MTRARRCSRRGVTLVEVVMIVVVLAVAIPPMLGWMQQSAADRADAVNTARATVLASAVVESVLADVAGGVLGPAGLADAGVYLDTPITGLRARLQEVAAPFAALGMTYQVDFGPPVSASGAATGDAARDLFRVVSVSVSFPSARSGPRQLSVQTMVSPL